LRSEGCIKKLNGRVNVVIIVKLIVGKSLSECIGLRLEQRGKKNKKEGTKWFSGSIKIFPFNKSKH